MVEAQNRDVVNRVVVIGAGAAGLMAAAEAAKRSAQVILFEKNTKTGVKILMSGGTRCNLTHDTDARGITEQFGQADRFLRPSVGAFPPSAVVEMFNRGGLATKTESTGKIFPESDRALHVRDFLHQRAADAGVEFHLRTGVTGINRSDQTWTIRTSGGPLSADKLIVTAGGKSYPGCGTTGDAYDWLVGVGHAIVTPRPALVPLIGGDDWTHELSGLTLDDCVATVRTTGTKKPLVIRRGSWLFTHLGFSGPAALDVSGVMTAASRFSALQLSLDLAPDVADDAIRRELTLRSKDRSRRLISSVLGQWIPKRLASAIVGQVGPDCRIAELPRGAVHRLVDSIKRLPLPVTGTRGFEKAEVTAGGVSLAEVDPRSMASRIAAGLYIAGEVLDVDGPIGGYNFQAAFSTGKSAGEAASRVT